MREKIDWQRPQDLRMDREGTFLDVVFWSVCWRGLQQRTTNWYRKPAHSKTREDLLSLAKGRGRVSPAEVWCPPGQRWHSKPPSPRPPSQGITGRVSGAQPGTQSYPNAQAQRWQSPGETQPPPPGYRGFICWDWLRRSWSSTQWLRATQAWYAVRPIGTSIQAALAGFPELQSHQDNEADLNNTERALKIILNSHWNCRSQK